MNDELRPDAALQRYLDALRSDARPEELAGERASIDAMAAAVATMKGPIVHRLTSRTSRAAAIVTVTVIGIGGLAAAAAGGVIPASGPPEFISGLPESAPPDERPPLDTPGHTDESTTTTLAEEVGALAPTDEATAALVDDPDTTFDETQCAEGNHGKTVSSVAHATESGPGKGQIVREAAQSSCGKSADDEADDATDDEADDATETESQDEGGRPDGAGAPASTSPGQTGTAPGQTGSTPGQSESTPGQSESTPGQSGETPGQSGSTPGQSGGAGKAGGRSGD